MRRALPSLVTLAGLVLGFTGVVLGVPRGLPFLALSLGADVADGALARRLAVTSRAGGAFDLIVDIVLAHALVVRILPMPGSFVVGLVLALLQIAAIEREIRFSGRTLAWIGCVLWALL